MNRRNLQVDASVVALALGATLGILASGGFGTPDPGARTLDATGVTLAVAATAPMLASRYLPVPMYLISAVSSMLILGLGFPLDAPVGPVIAGYWVALAYSGDRSAIRRWAAMAAIGAFVPAIGIAYLLAGADGWAILPELTGWQLIIAGVWIAGDRTRLRHEQMAALEERARRTQREAEREHRLAAAQERTRIARELHDSAGHAISVILVQAGAARLLHERDPDRSRRALATIEDVARATMDDIDRLVRALREDDAAALPPTADPGAMEELLERYRADGLRIHAEVRGEHRALPSGVAWAAYRILQEALTNASRHGSGSADVSVCFGPDAVEIGVTNPVTAPPGQGGGGHGVVGMRERATLLGGDLEAGAGADGTYRLAARLPHREAAPVKSRVP